MNISHSSFSPQVLAWHDKYNKRMKERVKDEGYPVKNPTDILSDMVSCKMEIRLPASILKLAFEFHMSVLEALLGDFSLAEFFASLNGERQG